MVDTPKFYSINNENAIFERIVRVDNTVANFKPVCPIYINQVKFGRNITKHFLDKSKFVVMAVAPTQSGKTGSMVASVLFMNKHPEIKQSYDNVYILTGLSSKDWVDQTCERFPEEMHKNIYHRNNLNSFVKSVKGKKDVLIMIDEAQFACLPGQGLHKAFQETGLMDLKYVMEHNIKILFVSATPDGVIYDLNEWKSGVAIEYMDVPEKYVSISSLVERGQVKQYRDLCGYDRLLKCVNEKVLENIYALEEFLGDTPKYHLIRTHNGFLHDITIKNFKKCFQGKDYDYFSESKINMMKKLTKVPEKHTFIFIKEKLRCAQTIPKENLGILYERYTSTVNDSAIIQGFAGRLTGYHNNTTSIVFTNMESIDKYINLIDSRFEIPSVDMKAVEERISNIQNEEERDNAREHMINSVNDVVTWVSNSTKRKAPYTKGTFVCVNENVIMKVNTKIKKTAVVEEIKNKVDLVE